MSEQSNEVASNVIAKPFVRWAGGKGKIADELRALIPPYVGARPDRRYIEPFAGGAAAFFALSSSTAANGGSMCHAVLSDANEDLMAAYGAVKNDTDDVVQGLRMHAHAHAATGSAHYYAVRERWNASSGARCAADFLYLNRAGFNGLWRVSRSGKMNVPAGDRVVKPEDAERDNVICDETNLRACARVLANTRITSGDYTDVTRDVQAGDFVYFDPPYDGTFAAYTADGFDEDAQRALGHVARELVARGARVMISNADTPLIREVYTCADFKIGTLATRHSMAAAGDKRKRVDELVICGGGVKDWQQITLGLA